MPFPLYDGRFVEKRIAREDLQLPDSEAVEQATAIADPATPGTSGTQRPGPSQPIIDEDSMSENDDENRSANRRGGKRGHGWTKPSKTPTTYHPTLPAFKEGDIVLAKHAGSPRLWPWRDFGGQSV